MRALKATLIPVMLVLLGGCALDAVPDEGPVEAPPPPPPSVQVAHEEIDFEANHTTTPAVVAPTTPGQVNASAGSGSKPQPDPWKQAEDPCDPKKPQPDPWAPANPGSAK